MRAGNLAIETEWRSPPEAISEAERAERDILAWVEEVSIPDPALLAIAFGVFVRTPGGAIPLRELRPGDQVDTLDDGPLRILAIEKIAPPNEPPVVLNIGAFGAENRAIFGPKRRLYYRGGAADLLFGAPEVLVEAAHLPCFAGATRGEWPPERDVFALEMEAPALIWIDGVLTETGPAPVFAASRPVLKPMEAAALLSYARRC